MADTLHFISTGAGAKAKNGGGGLKVCAQGTVSDPPTAAQMLWYMSATGAARIAHTDFAATATANPHGNEIHSHVTFTGANALWGSIDLTGLYIYMEDDSPTIDRVLIESWDTVGDDMVAEVVYNAGITGVLAECYIGGGLTGLADCTTSSGAVPACGSGDPASTGNGNRDIWCQVQAETIGAGIVIDISGDQARNHSLLWEMFAVVCGDARDGQTYCGSAYDALKAKNSLAMANPNATWYEVDFDGIAGDGLALGANDNLEWRGFHLHNTNAANGQDVITAANGCVGPCFRRCRIQDGSDGVEFSSVTSYTAFHDCYFSNSVRGININGYGNLIEGCIFEDHSAAHVNQASSLHTEYHDNWFMGGAIGIYATTNAMCVTGNTFYLQTTTGVQLNGSANIAMQINNNIFYLAATSDYAVFSEASDGTIQDISYNCFWSAGGALTTPIKLQNSNAVRRAVGNLSVDPVLSGASGFNLAPHNAKVAVSGSYGFAGRRWHMGGTNPDLRGSDRRSRLPRLGRIWNP